MIYLESKISCAPVAQRIRAAVFGTAGRGFEPLRVYHRKYFTSWWSFFYPRSDDSPKEATSLNIKTHS